MAIFSYILQRSDLADHLLFNKDISLIIYTFSKIDMREEIKTFLEYHA